MDNIKNNQLHMIADFEGDITELLKDRESGTYPIICTRDLVIFPTVLTPIILGRKHQFQRGLPFQDYPDWHPFE